ncbi:hypothetical protein HGB07_01860 [Candidatus Roizmanbacteria bacterium]|nr:hypothetical protein [Candidatus Roizmanbacteria bacterium]
MNEHEVSHITDSKVSLTDAELAKKLYYELVGGKIATLEDHEAAMNLIREKFGGPAVEAMDYFLSSDENDKEHPVSNFIVAASLMLKTIAAAMNIKVDLSISVDPDRVVKDMPQEAIDASFQRIRKNSKPDTIAAAENDFDASLSPTRLPVTSPNNIGKKIEVYVWHGRERKLPQSDKRRRGTLRKGPFFKR